MANPADPMLLPALVAQHTGRSVMILDPNGVIEWVNAGFTDLIGYTSEEVVGRPASFLYGYGADSSSGKLIEQRIRAGVGADVELLHYTKAGDPLWIRSEIRPVRDAAGALEHFVVMEVDLLQEERAARKVREDEERWMLALEVNDVAVWDYDVAEHLMLGSRRWAEILVLPSAEISGDEIADLWNRVHPDELPSFMRGWNELLVGSMTAMNLRIRLRIGDLHRHLRVRARVVRRDVGGQAMRVVGTLVDVHEATLLQMQAANATKLESIGELAAGIAHEINTPTQYVGDNVRFLGDSFQTIGQCLTVLENFVTQSSQDVRSQQVQRQLEAFDLAYLQEEIPKAIAQSLDGIDRIAKIVGAMKEFSHPGQEATLTDLNHAIANTIVVATNEWKYVATVETSLDPELPLVPVVPGEFNQVVLNIIVNAAHAIGDAAEKNGARSSGHIRVTTRHARGWAEILIADDGCGMPEHVQQKIFDPFFTTKPVGKGTGQGLAIAHNVIVKKHQGTIKVDSEPGRGTTFTIRLPLTPEAAGATDVAHADDTAANAA